MKQESAHMIGQLSSALASLQQVTNSDTQSRQILAKISELVNPVTVTESASSKACSNGAQPVRGGEVNRLEVYDSKGTRRLTATGKATWHLDSDGALYINKVDIVDHTVKRPSIAERTRNMTSSEEIVNLAKVLSGKPDTTIGELEELAKLAGRSAVLMLV